MYIESYTPEHIKRWYKIFFDVNIFLKRKRQIYFLCIIFVNENDYPPKNPICLSNKLILIKIEITTIQIILCACCDSWVICCCNFKYLREYAILSTSIGWYSS